MSCVPRVANVSGLSILGCSSVFSTVYLFVFVLCLVCRWLPVSLDCSFLFASSVFSNVYLFVFVLCLVCRWLPMSLDCPFLVASSVFSNVYLFVFVLCLVCLGLPMSLDCPFLFSPRFSLRLFVCLRSVSCVPRVANVSGLFILGCSSVFSNVYLFVFVLCLVCRRLPMSLDCPFLIAPWFSLTFICLSSSCVLCAEGCQCLLIVHS